MMKHDSFPFVILSVLLIVLFSTLTVIGYASSHDPALVETRYCGEPKRNASGTIIRRSAVRDAFRKQNPCPSTGLTMDACPGWTIDHVKPLASCGCDSVSNMQWLPIAIKSAAGTLPKDRWERRIYKCAGDAIQITPMQVAP